MKLIQTNRTKVAAAVLGVAAVVAPAAVAKQGSDDPAGHVRHAAQLERHHKQARTLKAKRHRAVQRDRAQEVGDDRGGRGGDDPAGHR